MKKLPKYLKDCRLESILGPLFKMLGASFELFVPLVMVRIIDIEIKSGDTGYILKIGGALILLGMVGLTCSLTTQYFSTRMAVGFGTALRNDLFKHINIFSYSEIDAVGMATLVTRMTSDANQVQNEVNMVPRLFLRSPLIVFGAMVMAFTIDARSTLIFVVAIPLFSVVVFGILIISMPLYKKVQRQLDRVLLTTRESLLGARVVRTFNRQQDEYRKFNEESGLLAQFQVFVGRISALVSPATCIIINGAIIVLIWTRSWQVENDVVIQGEVVALVNYMSQILVKLVRLANLIIIISKSLASTNRTSSVFNIPDGLAEKNRGGTVDSGSGRMKVEFQNLGFVYAGAKKESLEEIPFAAEKGQTIGIIGGIGSGKPTLVNMIPRFYDATTGVVLVDGVDVKEYSFEQLWDKTGVVPQKAVLFKGTIRGNIQWGKKDATDKEIYEALRTAQAAAFVEEKNEGLDLPILQGGKNLSDGQKQRLTIARALVKRPEILILDDGASALDFATDAALRKAIRESTRDITVFIVSQRASPIWNSNRALILDDGHLAGSETHRELLKTCDVYREVCLSQLSEEVLWDEQA